MGQMTNLLVKDDAGAEITLVPITDTPFPTWRSQIAGVPLEGQMRLTCTSELMKNGSYRITKKTEIPVMETLGASGTSTGYVAPPKVAYVNTHIETVFADKRSTNADRANLLKIGAGLTQGASSTTATGVLTNATAANGWANSVLPFPQHFIGVILPN